MKKSTISLSLLLLVGASCLTSCNKAAVKPLVDDNGKSVLFTIDGVPFYSDTLLEDDFFKSEEGSKLLYSEIEKSLIKNKVLVDDDINNAVDIKMDEWKEQVEQFAKENGLTERLAEQSLLVEKGFETRDQLRESYIYDEQKTKFIKNHQSDNMEPKVEKGSLHDFDKDKSLLNQYVKETNPMVMKHILVKVENKDNVFNQAAITEDESDKLGTVVKRLAMGNKSMNEFTEVAIALSDDEGSGAKGGNLGIVDEYTSFVDEFKYGVYSSIAYNAKHGINQKADSKSFDDVVKALNFEESDMFTTGIYSEIGTIDVLDAYDVLVNHKEDTAKDAYDKTKEDENKYPRNKKFNEEFNNKSAQYLKVTDKAATAKAFGCAESDLRLDANNYVVDENNNPIVVVRSEFGIHFISVTYNSLDHKHEDNVKYFMTNKSLEGSENGYYQNTFFDIGHKQESQHTSQKNRKNEIEGRVLNYFKGGFGATVAPDEELFNYIIISNLVFGEKPEITIPEDTDLGKSIKSTMKKYIDNKIEASNTKVENAQSLNIEAYVNKIEADQAAYNDVYGK